MEEYRTYRLGDIAECTLGKMLDQKKNKGKPHVYLGNVAVRWGAFNIDPSQAMRFEDKEIEKFQAVKGDIILCEGGEPGRCAIWEDDEPICIQKALHRIRVDQSIASPYYVYYYLTSFVKSGKAEPYFTGSTIKHLPRERLISLELTLPCLDEQKRRARIIQSLDAKISLNNRINHNLEEQAQIVFDRIFNSDLTNNCLLSSIVDINPKRTLRKNEVARCIDMTYLNTAGSFPSGWEFKPYSGGMKFINGDTLMARITPCLENGKVAYINFLDKEETAFGSTEYIVFHAKDGYPNEMFYFLTRNKAFIEFATKNMNGSSGRQRVSGETIGNYIIPVLSEDDINELKTVSESTMKEILKNNLESRVLSEMRNTILPKLMSGELKINDLTC